MHVYIVEEVIDLGNHVLKVCSTITKAMDFTKKYELTAMNDIVVVEYEVDSNSEGKDIYYHRYYPKGP